MRVGQGSATVDARFEAKGVLLILLYVKLR